MKMEILFENIPSNLVETSVFGHIIHIPLPSIKEREMIIKTKITHHLLRDPTELIYQEIANAMVGLTLGEILYICEECLRTFLSDGNLSIENFHNSISILKETKVNNLNLFVKNNIKEN